MHAETLSQTGIVLQSLGAVLPLRSKNLKFRSVAGRQQEWFGCVSHRVTFDGPCGGGRGATYENRCPGLARKGQVLPGLCAIQPPYCLDSVAIKV